MIKLGHLLQHIEFDSTATLAEHLTDLTVYYTPYYRQYMVWKDCQMMNRGGLTYLLMPTTKGRAKCK